MRQGILFVASGPSGTGKTTLCRRVEKRLQIPHGVSYTTRPPRPQETEGKDYHFVSDVVFDQMIENGAFLEWAKVHGYRYGTSLATVYEAIKKGQDLILDLDTQGALNIKNREPQSVLIFIDAPDDRVLAERLGKRGTENYDKIKQRLKKAKEERQMKEKYDYVLLNEDLEKTYLLIASLIEKERNKRG